MIHATMNRLCPKDTKDEITHAKENILEDLQSKEMKQTFPFSCKNIRSLKEFANVLVIL